MSQTTQTSNPNSTLTQYLSRLAGQEGLYVGLGLGVVMGGLLATRDIKATLGRALALIKTVEEMAAEFQDGVVIDVTNE